MDPSTAAVSALAQHQRSLGSSREGPIPHCRRGAEYLLCMLGEDKAHIEWHDKVHATLPLQRLHDSCQCLDGCIDTGYDGYAQPSDVHAVSPRLVRMSSSESRSLTPLLVAYMIKLNIEMSMAHLIGKIAKSNDSSNFQYGFPYNGGEDGSSAGFHRTGSTRSPQASSRYDIQRSACTTTTTKSFGSTMSDVEAWPYEGYPAKAVSDINTFELTKTKEFNGHRRPEVTHNWRKTQSDDTVVWSDTDFSGISRATDATAVADAWRASRGTFPEGSKGTYQPWI